MEFLKKINTMAKYYSSFASYELAKIYLSSSDHFIGAALKHLNAAARWMCRAQDAFPGGGVARSYSLVHNLYFGKSGWTAPYPETTGYIIPTMFDYAKFSGNGEMHDRAVRMADWECEVQLDNGAVQGGTIDQPPAPAIFNTGQVVFGWVRAFLETGEEKYLSSARRAGEYLIREQDSDGAWRNNLSNYASRKMETYTYNTRTAWSLIFLHSVTKEDKFKEGATRNIDWSLRQQRKNGWFRDNCLWDPDRPVLHTIAYCIRGILETGTYTGTPGYVEAARRAAEALLARQRKDGSLPGRFDSGWEPAASWSCLTGDAQTSIIWGRLYQETREPKFLEGMKRTNRYLKKIQFTRTGNPDLFGGIAGSDPIHGNYGRFEVLSWAVKFFMDALMLEMAIEGRRVDG